MNIFVIDANNRISMVSSETEAAPQPGMERFQSARQFNDLAQAWSGSHFVRIWNQLPGVNPVKKFTDRKTAVTRIWNAIQNLEAARSVAPNQGRKGHRLVPVPLPTNAEARSNELAGNEIGDFRSTSTS